MNVWCILPMIKSPNGTLWIQGKVDKIICKTQIYNKTKKYIKFYIYISIHFSVFLLTLISNIKYNIDDCMRARSTNCSDLVHFLCENFFLSLLLSAFEGQWLGRLLHSGVLADIYKLVTIISNIANINKWLSFWSVTNWSKIYQIKTSTSTSTY